MKLTRKSVIAMYYEAQDKSIKKHALDYILESWDDHAEKERIILDVLEYGCISGMVGGLIYYRDTTAFYERHKQEINDLLAETLQSCGCDMKDLFRDNYDCEDPLCLGACNQNLLAWFGFEETMRAIASEFNLGF